MKHLAIIILSILILPGLLTSCGDSESCTKTVDCGYFFVCIDQKCVEYDDSNRDDCKKACEKLLLCNTVAEGGSGALTDQWLVICKNACDEADEIEEIVTECLINTECANIAIECGSQYSE